MKPIILSATLLALTHGSGEAQQKRHTSQYTIGPSLQPLVIHGEGWTQQFTIVNVDYYQGGEPTVGTVRFFTANGDPWRLPIKGRGAVDGFLVNLHSGQMLTFETELSFQPQQLGWMQFALSSNIDEWGIYHAFTTFRKQAADRPDLMTSASLVDDLEDEWIIALDTTEGKYPGIALVNGDAAERAFRLEVFDAAGTLRKTIDRRVRPRGMAWFSLIGENHDLADISGQIKIATTGFRSGAFALQFTPNGAFTAIPIVHTYGR